MEYLFHPRTLSQISISTSSSKRDFHESMVSSVLVTTDSTVSSTVPVTQKALNKCLLNESMEPDLLPLRNQCRGGKRRGTWLVGERPDTE